MLEKMILVVALSIVFASTSPTTGKPSPTVGHQDPELRVFEGKVVDQKGKPIAGAAVEWGHFRRPLKYREVFRTDKDGRYRVETTRVGKDFRLGVSAEGFAPHWRDRLIPARADSPLSQIDFELRASSITLRGHVVDKTGKPVVGVKVFAESPSWGFYSSFSRPMPQFPFPGEPFGVTDEDGKFEIPDLPATRMNSLNAAEAEENQRRGHPYALSIRTKENTLQMPKGYQKLDNKLTVKRSDLRAGDDARGELHAKVVDAQTGMPIKDFGVVARHNPKTNWFRDDAGEFRLDHRLGRRRQIFVYAKGYAPAIEYLVAKRPSNEAPIEPAPIRLDRYSSLEGIVVDQYRKPIKGARILYGLAPADPQSPNQGNWNSWEKLVDGYLGLETVQRMTTDQTGTFWFSDQDRVSRQKPRMMILAPGYQRRIVFSEEFEKVLRDDGTLRISLYPESVLYIEVLANGEFDPNTDVRVRAISVESYQLRLHDFYGLEPAKSDGRDGYLMKNLVPGQYLISATTQRGTDELTLSKQVEVGEGETAQVAIEIQSGNHSLHGETAPFARIQVRLKEPTAEGCSVKASTHANADGRYSFKGLLAGTYEVWNYEPNSELSTYFRSDSGRTSIDVEVQGDVEQDFKQTRVQQWQLPATLESSRP